jgi:hypothetical protein
MSSSGNARVKFLVVIAFLLLASVGVWEGRNLFNKPAPPPPLPMPTESRPALPVQAMPKPLVVPGPIPVSAPIPKKPVAVKKVPHRPAAPSKPIVPSRPVVAPPPVPPVYIPPPPPEPLEWHGTDTSINHQGQIVVRNDGQWIHFWSEHHPHEAAPEVDFSRDMVVGVVPGARPADQFSVKILGVRTVSGSLIVDYREIPPPPGTFAMGVTVYPYDLKVIPRTTLPVKFNLYVAQQ